MAVAKEGTMKKWFYSILLASVAFAFSASAKVCFLPNDPEACFDDLAEAARNGDTCQDKRSGMTLEWALCETSKYNKNESCKDEVGLWYKRTGCADGYMDLAGDDNHHCQTSYEKQTDSSSADCGKCCPAVDCSNPPCNEHCDVYCNEEFKYICRNYHNSKATGEQCADCDTGLSETEPLDKKSTECTCKGTNYDELCTGTGQTPFKVNDDDYCKDSADKTYYQACLCENNYQYECKNSHNVGVNAACSDTANNKTLYTECQCASGYVERTSTSCSTLCPKTNGYTGVCTGVSLVDGDNLSSSEYSVLESKENTYCVRSSFHCQTCAEGGYTQVCVGINVSPETPDDYCTDADGVKKYKSCKSTCESPKADFDNYWQGYGVSTCHNLTVDCTTLGYDSTKKSCNDGSAPYRCPFDHTKTYCPD